MHNIMLIGQDNIGNAIHADKFTMSRHLIVCLAIKNYIISATSTTSSLLSKMIHTLIFISNQLIIIKVHNKQRSFDILREKISKRL